MLDFMVRCLNGQPNSGMRKLRGGLRPLVSARPDQVAGAVLALDQGGVDRSREARIVELDRVVGPTLLRGPLPRGAELDVGAGDDAVVRGLVAVLLEGHEPNLGVEGEGLDRAAEAVAVLGEGADDPHDCSPLRFTEAAPIAALMGSTRPGAIGPHPKGRSAAQSGEGRLFCPARNAAGRGKELARAVAAPDRGKAGPRPRSPDQGLRHGRTTVKAHPESAGAPASIPDAVACE